MLKVMLVDDEFYFREALKISLPWKELGFDICGEAKNGKDALDKVGSLKPEIIIVDINMPIMDGLEFVQNVREKGIDSKIIILTGHSEFNYAKQAVQLGVHNYILKPVNEEELAESLDELKRVIEKEASIKIEVDQLKQQVKDSLPLLRDKFLNELMQGSFMWKEKQTVKKMEYLHINTGSSHYRVITIEIDYEDSRNWTDGDKQLWKFAVSNISNEILSDLFTFDMCFDNEDRICILLGTNEHSAGVDNASGQQLTGKLELIRTAVCKYLNFSISVGIGNEKNGLHEVAASYKESIVALRNKLVLGKNRVIPYSSVADSEIKVNLFTAEHRSQLLMNLRTGEDGEVQKLIQHLFKEIRSENIHHEFLFVRCIEMVSVCLEFIVEAGLSVKDILPGHRLNIIEEIQSKRSIDEMEEWIVGIFRHTLETNRKNRSSKASRLIEEVKRYIRENYQNDELTVDTMAKSLFVNYAHLSFLFKRDTGTTINEYLTEFRITRAKELFDSGNTLILDVAERVGYSDANYFGKCFKKYYGLAPSRYIENIRHS